jgi:hypothetical protein
MFSKGVIRDEGIDITIKNNAEHFLAPDNWDMVIGVKFGKISKEEFKTYYLNLLRKRWATRKEEFVDLARKNFTEDIVLKCFCPKGTPYCHAQLASDFMNALTEKLKASQ